MTSTWHARPSDARWFCEAVFEKDGERDYNSGYSSSVQEPDHDSVWDLVPSGYTLIEYSVNMTPQTEGVSV